MSDWDAMQRDEWWKELQELRVENAQLREEKLKRDDLVEQVRSMHAENERLKSQLDISRDLECKCWGPP